MLNKATTDHYESRGLPTPGANSTSSASKAIPYIIGAAALVAAYMVFKK